MNSTNHQPPNPFPGLRPFRSDEHHLFFGREEQTAALLQLLRTNRFLAVVGTSGSGKSSLVRAGMIAELHGGTMTQAGSTWEIMILRPGGSPIRNLARAFVDADLYDPEDPDTLPRLLATLNRSRFGLVEATKQSELFEPGTNLLVVIDQFEELFRFRQQGVDSEETAAAFVNLLLTASEQAECPIYVTITMRSDYLGDCSEIPGLAEAVNEGEYLIPRLLRDQKRDAIEKPIGVGGAKISPLLVQRLLNEVGDDPDQLPVMQHALMRMWGAWSTRSDNNRPIDFGDFEATGGLGAALSNHADEVYDSLPDGRHRSSCEKIFKTLTVKGDDNRGIRRPTRLAQLQAIAGADRDTVTTVLDAFRGSGITFLMPGTEVELSDRTVLDLSHESLMRGWERLRGWVEDEAQSARVFRRLLDTAQLWSDGKAGLFHDPDLQIALSWREREAPNAQWAEQYGGNFQTAICFLEASNAEVEAERQAKEAARQRELAQAQELAESRKQRLMQQQRAARRLRKLIADLTAPGFRLDACVAVRLLAYCLMPNHFHLAVWPRRDGDLRVNMMWLMTAHVRRYHQHYHTSGHVWQGRFRSFPIQEDGRLLTVHRYIERDPVRAGLVERAEDWQWSSASGGHESWPVLDPGPVPRPARWRAYVNQPLTEAEVERLRECSRRRRPYGDAAWTVKTARRMDLEDSLRPRGRPRKHLGPESSLFGEEESAGECTLAQPTAVRLDRLLGT